MTVHLVGNLQVGAVFPKLAASAQAMAGLSTQGAARAKVDLPEIDADLGGVQADLGIIQSSILGLTQTMALGPAAVVAGAMEAVVSGKMMAGLVATGPQLLTSLTGVLAELTAKLGAITAKQASLTVKKASIAASLPTFDASASFAAELQSLMIKGGARLYVYEGTLGNLGADIDAHINGGGNAGVSLSATVWVPFIVTDDPGTEAALQQIIPDV